MSRASFREQAETDVFETAQRISEEAGSLKPAHRFIDVISEKADLLATQPLMGRERPDLAANLRSFPVGPFVLFYLPVADGVEIVRVLRASRDAPALF